MFVRTSTWSGSQEALERWTQAVIEKVKPFAQGLPGNVGAYFVIDRESGEAMTITVWETEDAAKATDTAANQSRSRTMEGTGVTLVRKGRYEVVTSI